MHTPRLRLPGFVACALWLASACSSSDGPGPDGEAPPDLGATEFVSADGVPGQNAPGDNTGAGGAAAPATESADAADGGGQERSVEEGDIYRVLDNGRILNLNSYRGLQVIDVAEPSEPEIIGALSLQGYPVEMYVVGDRALLLLNNWQGYYGTRDDVAVERREGGLVVAVDLSKPTAPREIDRKFIEGYIRTSRVVRNDSVGALYVASSSSTEEENAQGAIEWVDRTVVTSFDIGGERLAKKSELDLGGYVSDIQATPEVLLVASQDWTQGNGDRSEVAVIDISDPNGAMARGDVVRAAGSVNSQFNMDMHNGVLRVVSTNWNTQGNRVETFDASDIGAITPLDDCSFGAGQELYATLFLGNKAFFVTYFRQDPFHAFEIADDGTCTEHNEYIVSGWNDFFRPVAGGTRLIGIGQDDAESSRTPAVSLYDITDLKNPDPLLMRASGRELDWSWSEANWDHRAFSVLEDAVSVDAADGTLETGLVLLPYQGWATANDEHGGRSFSGVQLFTFSDTSVTARAAFDNNAYVRRAFLASDDMAAALSETSLSLFDHRDPDAPRSLGELALAPDYGQVFEFGDYVVRLSRLGYAYRYDLSQSDEVPSARIEVVAAGGDPNASRPMASIEVPMDATLLRAGDDLLASITYRVIGETDSWPYDYRTKVELFDFSDPLHPEKRGSAETDALVPSYLSSYDDYYGWGGRGALIGCGLGGFWFSGSQQNGNFALGDQAIVFTTSEEHHKSEGQERHCSMYSRNSWCDRGDCERVLLGGRECSSLNGGADVCSGNLMVCSVVDSVYDCEPIAFEEVEGELERNCWDGERTRYWASYNFTALDIRDPDRPVFGATLEMPNADEAVRVVPQGSSIYYSYRRPLGRDDAGRPLVAYFFKEVDFGDPEDPAVSSAINVPGELIAIDGDNVYTKDLRWGQDRAETYLHALTRSGSVARLDASHHFAGRQVQNVVSTAGNLLVSHRPTYLDYWYPGVEQDETTKLTILGQDGLSRRSEVDVDAWSTLEAAHEGRALYTVPGGLLVFDVEDPEKPHAQAFFHSNGWPQQILFDGGDVLVAAGQYGIYRFDVDEFNLLAP